MSAAFANKVIKILVFVEFVVNSAFGAFTPVFAIFIIGSIHGGNAEVVGFATAVYWIVKSVIQLPVARFVDKYHGEIDDFLVLIIGYILASISVFFYIFATTPLHIYLIEGFMGMAMAFAVPGWYGIFARHVDKEHESFEWSLISVFSVGIATAVSGAAGGIIVTYFGYKTLFIGASAFSLFGSLLLLLLRPYLYPHSREKTWALPLQDKPSQKLR
ncbi:MAG: MFS transporter [Parcubacteria group bacterium]|nr:MFS transporter [Parcubacteria group bacterium]